MDALQDRVEVPDPVMAVGTRVTERLVELVVAARLTVPAKPLTGLIVMVDVPDMPAFTVTLVGLAVMVKSWTWNVTVAEWNAVPVCPLPLVPVTVAR